MNVIVVINACTIRFGQLPKQSFAANEEVQPSSPYYKVLLWSGLANDTGVPGDPDGPSVQPNQIVATAYPTPQQHHHGIRWDATDSRWVVFDLSILGGGTGGTGEVPEHTHPLPDHTHDLPDHTHDLPVHNHSADEINTGMFNVARLPSGSKLAVLYSGTAWPARPTSRGDVVVEWLDYTGTADVPAGAIDGLDQVLRRVV